MYDEQSYFLGDDGFVFSLPRREGSSILPALLCVCTLWHVLCVQSRKHEKHDCDVNLDARVGE